MVTEVLYQMGQGWRNQKSRTSCICSTCALKSWQEMGIHASEILVNKFIRINIQDVHTKTKIHLMEYNKLRAYNCALEGSIKMCTDRLGDNIIQIIHLHTGISDTNMFLICV